MAECSVLDDLFDRDLAGSDQDRLDPSAPDPDGVDPTDLDPTDGDPADDDPTDDDPAEGGPEPAEAVPGSRSRVLRTGLVGTVIAVATLALALPVRGLVSGGTAFEIRRLPGDTVSVRIVDPDVPASEMTEQLRKAGLDVSVSTLSASPQLVGAWLPDAFFTRVPAEAVEPVVQQLEGYVRTLEIPATVRGPMRLAVAVAPRGSRMPQVVGRRNVLAPGGALACRGLSGAVPETAAEQLRALGYTPVFVGGTKLDSPTLDRVPSGSRVVAGYVEEITPATVRLVLDEPGSRHYRSRIGLGFPPSAMRGDVPADSGCPG
jgi:hypothetical protein